MQIKIMHPAVQTIFIKTQPQLVKIVLQAAKNVLDPPIINAQPALQVIIY